MKKVISEIGGAIFNLKDYTSSKDLSDLKKEVESLKFDGPSEGKKNIKADFYRVGADMKKATKEAKQKTNNNCFAG